MLNGDINRFSREYDTLCGRPITKTWLEIAMECNRQSLIDDAVYEGEERESLLIIAARIIRTLEFREILTHYPEGMSFSNPESPSGYPF